MTDRELPDRDQYSQFLKTSKRNWQMVSSKIDSLYAAIDSLFDAGQISDGTYQFAADLIQEPDPDIQDYDVVAHA